jgi:hypothetical protein
MAGARAQLALVPGHPGIFRRPGQQLAYLVVIQMTIQIFLWELRSSAAGPLTSAKFLIAFIGIVGGPFLLLAVDGRNQTSLSDSGLLWFFLAILTLLCVGTGIGYLQFQYRNQAVGNLSINPTSR